MTAGIEVRKTTGQIEPFEEDKLRTSILRAGAPAALVDQIASLVKAEIGTQTSSRKIYRLAKKYLNRLHHPTGLRYALKRALFRLGPTGYPFERFMGEILNQYDYSTKVGVLLEGKCVRHEVDVLAQNDNHISVIECKYHNQPGTATDVKVALYVHSRVRDLEPVLLKDSPGKTYSGWLVTNTRCTTDAIAYAECVGLKVVAWRYPAMASLEGLIEQKRLYPVTIISGIKRGLVEKLIENRVILLKDLTQMDIGTLMHMLPIDERQARTLKRHAEEICLC